MAIDNWSTLTITKESSLSFSPHFIRIQFSSVAQLCPTLCDTMNRSTPGHVHHQLLEFTHHCSERWENLPEVTEQTSGRMGSRTRHSLHQGLCPFYLPGCTSSCSEPGTALESRWSTWRLTRTRLLGSPWVQSKMQLRQKWRLRRHRGASTQHHN